MKNKSSVKDRREAEIARRKSLAVAVEEKKNAAAEKTRREELERAAKKWKDERAQYISEHPDENQKGHSLAKAAGVKSTFTLNDHELLMTSYGRGNKAILEKHVTGSDVFNINDPQAYSAEPREKVFEIRGRIPVPASIDNPLFSSGKSGKDQIDCRENLEKIFFGDNFTDNIHIQAAYSILDIDKILALHINNIIYEIDNMLRTEKKDLNDLVGYLSLKTTYETFTDPSLFGNEDRRKTAEELLELFNKLTRQPQLGYFGPVLFNDQVRKAGYAALKKENPNALEMKAIKALQEEDKRCYYLLALLGTARQSLAHGSAENRSAIYQLGPEFDPKKNTARAEARKYLDALYGERVSKLNDEFLKNAEKDLVLLFRALSIRDKEQKKEYVRLYYDFVVRKEYKNTGFSIKSLREVLLAETPAKEAADHKYDTVRPKLNRFMDFAIYDHYRRNPDLGDDLVARLRTNVNKEAIYREEAKKIWPALSDVIMAHILPNMSGSIIKGLHADRDVSDKAVLDGVKLSTEAEPFCELIYLMTRFLDGKEINDLLTTLISKFEAIVSFVDVMKAMNIPCSFTKEYDMFNRCGKIASELRCINSFARMSGEETNVKPVQFMEAAWVLGYPGSDEELIRFADEIFSKEGGKLKPNGKKDNGFRNFIINNVINSDRFRYLVRFGNAKKIRALAGNRLVIDFVLKDIPDAQILRYYDACTGTENSFDPAMRGKLAELITGMSFENFKDVHQDKDGTADQLSDKQRKQAVIRLYLTVLYLLIKNMVYINSRYFLAFHCVERDVLLYDPEFFNKTDDCADQRAGAKKKQLKDDYSVFARKFLETHKTNRNTMNPEKGSRSWQYIQKNLENSDPFMIGQFRNCVEHLNVVRNMDAYIGDLKHFSSYFELYHYLLQRYLMDQYAFWKDRTGRNGGVIISEDTINPKTLRYFSFVERNHVYCKDFVKALNVPFAYNLARYKNLSIDALFDRNRMPDPKEQGKGAGLKADVVNPENV